MGCGLSNQVGDRLGGSPGGTLSPKRINPGYTHNVAVPSEAQRKTLDAILAGDMEIACPSNAKIVRIFTSSTFTDTQHERNALMEKVYPKLKAFCQERGYEFQVVDMRWGVRDEATDDHMATELCLKEVLDCKKVSTGPNFVTFLSHKYGYRPMPRMIAIDELDNVVIKVNEDERSLIERWYKKDTNHVPSMYVMQPVSRIIPDFITGDQKRNEEAKSQWWNVMQKLRQIFMRNVDGALKDKYRFSVTENEICRGILESSDAAQSTIWYHRVFHHITMDRDNPQLSRHVDTMEDDSSVLLNSLKNKLANVLPDRNIQTYNLKWSKKGFDPVAVNDHRKYIQQFCSDFEHQMQELVVQAISERVHFDSLDPLYEDIIQHVSFCQNKCEAFQGREDTLSIIESYIKNSAHKLPLVIHGPSGSGKTSIVAMAAKMTRKWTTDNTAIVIRFLGTTSASSSIRSVLYGLVKQINIIYKLDNRVPEDLKQLIRSLREQLTNASEERPLVIFLDSLDQLDTGDGAQQLAWLPTDLPNNVKIVLSTLPEEKYEYYPRLKTILPSSDNFVGVPELAEQDVQDIIQKWFSNENKTLTDNQMQVLVNTCQRCPIPLFLKISFVESCRWYSYSDMNETILQETVRDAIITLFERIEKNHGSIMVSRALGYITAGKSGLTENELEDLLSLDDDVLNDVYQYWTPPIRRLPPLLWVRIRAELSDYLVDRGADGVRVVYWYHRQFIEAANDRYMSDTNTTMNLHSNMADYFLGRWSKGVKKPYTNRKGEHCESDRLVAAQPLLFDAGTYNLRKLSEMPYHLLKCERWDTLKETVLCNLEWLYTKTKATSLKNVLEDFRTTRLKYANDKQINTIAEVIQLSQEALLHDPAQLASQLVARLPNTQGLEDILDQAKRSPALCFMPSHPFMTPPGGQLLHTLSGHRETISAFDVSSDGCLALTGDDFTNVKLWDVESGYLIKSVMEYTKNDGGSIKCVRFCDSDRVFAVSLNNIVKIFRTDTLAEVRIIEPYDDDETSGVPFAMAGSCKDKLVIPCHRKVVVYDITTGSRICRIIDAKLLREYFEETHIEARGNTIAYYNEHVEKHSNLLRIVDLSQDTPTPDTINVYPDVKTYEDGYEEITSIGALALTCDDEVIVSNMMDNDLKIYNTKSLELLRILKGTKSDFSQHFYITQDDRYLLFPNSSSDVCIWDLQTETKEYRLKHPNSVERVASLDYKRVVTVGGDNLVRVWDATRSDSVQYIVKRDWKFYRGQHEEHKSYTVSKAQSSAKTQNDKDDDNTDSFTDLWSIPGQKRYVLAQSQRNKQYSITIWDCATTKPVLRIQSRAGEGKGGGSKFHLTILNNNEALCFVNRKLKLLNYTNGKIVRVFKGQLAYSGSICIVNNHREVLTTTSHGRNLKLYDIQTGSVVTILKQSDEKTKDSKSVIDVKVKSDGKGTVAVSVLDEDEQKCYVWDIPKRSLKHIMKLPDTYSNEKGQVFDYNIDLTDSDISADETYICTIQSLHCEKSRIVAWNLKTGVFQCTLCNDGEGEPNTVKIIESNKVVVSYWDGLKEIWIWSILSAEILLKFPGHQNYEVDKLIISEDERRLLSYTPRSEEREFILWDIQTGNKIAGFTQEDNAEMVLVYGGDMVAVGCNSIGAIVTFNLQGPNVDKLDTGGHSFYKDVDNVIMVDLTEASDNNIDVDDVDSDEESEHDDDEDTDNFDDREMSDDEDDLNAGYIRNDLDTDDEK